MSAKRGSPRRPSTPAQATPEQLETAKAGLAAAGLSAFSKLFLACFSAEQAAALERAGRILFSRSVAGAFTSRPGGASHARRQFLAALEDLRLLAGLLESSAAAKRRLEEGDVEAAYFDHASTNLAGALRALADAQLALRHPTAGDLDAFRDAFPADSATYLVHTATAGLRSAARSLGAAQVRYQGLLVASPEPGAFAGRLVAAVALGKVLSDHLLPGLEMLDELDNPGALPEAAAWAFGPWQALDAAARQMADLAERLLAASEALADDELESEPGAALALALIAATRALQTASREASRARDGLERPALTGLPRSKRVALRLEAMARLAGGWQEELEGVADRLDLERIEAGLGPDVPLRGWIEEQNEGPLAEVVATLLRVAARVPPDTEPRSDQVF